ncbi:MAG TPA: SCP2 sterol-binding domain-containing protein [Dehalococcoidia bacterium]|nr:SCP2 sterol-binding domain-containing protein [Dehalococcoidia bacterium]
MANAPMVYVRLAGGAESGLASIVQQYLEQDLAEFEKKRRQAARLQGRIAMTAVDHETTVTVEFNRGEIAVWDGERPPLDASIVGPYRALLRLLQGEAHPLVEHLRGRLRVRSSLRKPLFPLRVHALMKLPPEKGRRSGRAWAYALVAAAAAVLLGAAVAAALTTT